MSVPELEYELDSSKVKSRGLGKEIALGFH